MRWHRNLRLSLRAIWRAPARTTLSIGGVAVGIASVVVLVGSGKGAERALLQALERLGRNVIVVNAARRPTGALRGAGQLDRKLSLGDRAAIDREVPGILRSAPMAERSMLASGRGRAVAVRVSGTSPEFGAIRGYRLEEGRFLDGIDVDGAARVAVVGALVTERLFRGESPLGEQLLIGGVPFRVVGVAEKRGAGIGGSNEDEVVVIPVTTAMRRLMDADSLTRIFVQARSKEAVREVMAGIEDLLTWRHGIKPADRRGFTLNDQASLARSQSEAGASLSRVVVGMSLLALILGGVGLLAVCVLSVRERYGEIGLRLAVGGRPRDITMQFLAEAVMIAALGGATGVAAGAVAVGAGARLTSWPMVMSWEAVVYPLAVSVAIAVIFGSWPAVKASRLDPIQALNRR